MRRILMTLTLTATLVLFAQGAQASCSTQSIMIGGRLMFCTTCCSGSHCTTTCI